jgi:hypothetical protein
MLMLLSTANADTTEAASISDGRSDCSPTWRLVEISELKPLPGLPAENLIVDEVMLLAIAKQCPRIWDEPITITQDGEVVDRYDVWILARRQRRTHVLCLIRTVTQEEAVSLMLLAQSRRGCINSYRRILIALSLVVSLRERAKMNQREGGRQKGSLNLTKAQKIDTRRMVAALAGVGATQVTKVQDLQERAIDEVKDALTASRLSIHAAWKLSFLRPDEQLRFLWVSLRRKYESRGRAPFGRIISQRSPGDRALIRLKEAVLRLGEIPEHLSLLNDIQRLDSFNQAIRGLEAEFEEPAANSTISC